MPAAFPYPTEVEKAMQVMYHSLRENDRRRYAAIEVAKLGHGGTDYIAALLDCDPQDHPPRSERPGTTPGPAPGGHRSQPAGPKKGGWRPSPGRGGARIGARLPRRPGGPHRRLAHASGGHLDRLDPPRDSGGLAGT